MVDPENLTNKKKKSNYIDVLLCIDNPWHKTYPCLYNILLLCYISGHGGGWGYSGHSIEAVRFMPDTDILLGGFGLFGGRGEYFGKIKVGPTKYSC